MILEQDLNMSRKFSAKPSCILPLTKSEYPKEEEGKEMEYYEMDYPELTKLLFSRIKKLEPENFTKIMGCILLKEPSEQEMFDLTYGTDMALSSKINDAKIMLDMLPPKTSMPVMQFGSYPPSGSRHFAHMNFHVPSYWGPHIASDHHHHLPNHRFEFVQSHFGDSIEEDYSLLNQSQLFTVEEQTNHMRKLYYADSPSPGGGFNSRINRRSHSLSELPIKACHYFNKGYCKHGMNCRYSHAQNSADGHIFSSDMNDFPNEDNGITPVSLEKLEMEITELLRSKRGTPVSIASLPMLYYDKYGRNLQAEGYLTESQRHGKVGLSLTKLLNRLKNSIKVIDRPHGQHSVILAEDAPRYPKCRNERNDSGSTVSSSHQIYLTFPAESTFTEEDVSNYFKQYGPVHDVRIPCQENRMFGFVSFLHSETVNIILMKRNPHYICGARVLVKPYREKSRNTDRKYTERIKPLNYYPSHYMETGPDIHTVREPAFLRVPKHQLLEDQEKMNEFESLQLSELRIGSKSLTQKHIRNYALEDYKTSKDATDLFMDFSYAFDALNNCSTKDNDRFLSNSYNDQESGHIELPDSPFGPTPIGTSISAVM